jgi:stage V sporulation protein D (sporulation-specific penicillin-binding protein)
VEGTGSNAGLAFLSVAGKTGTAQKASPRGGYHHKKFVASFVGFAPVEDPDVVCLVLLDEPNFNDRFGGVSAAPVFARIAEAIAGSSHIFDDVLTTTRVEKTVPPGRTFRAPNFLRLSRESAMERARMFDLNLLCRGGQGEVIAQDPDPGVAMDRDDVLRVYLGGSRSGTGGGKTPDLRGLPIRLARRRAAEAGFTCDVIGSGRVSSQNPAPGGVSKSGIVKIYCKSPTKEQKTG